MAVNVFGDPVTDDTVRLIDPNLTEITAKDRAQVALQYMNADDKATNVSEFVHNLKNEFGTGTSTLCMIYNATGGDLTFVMTHNWSGSVFQNPYPRVIENGQWAGILHVRDIVWNPSKEAIVYRGCNEDGDSRDWMLAWNTPLMDFQNHVYTEIRSAGSFKHANWNTIDGLMDQQGNNHSAFAMGCYSNVSIGTGSSPEFVGIMSLDGLDNNFMELARDVSAVSASLDSKYKDDVGGDQEGNATLN